MSLSRLPLAAGCLLGLAALAAAPAAHATGFACVAPYQSTVNFSLPANVGSKVVQILLPAGYRYQIEYAAGSIRVADSTQRATFALATVANGTASWHNLPEASTGYTLLDRVVSGPVQFYGDPNTYVNVEVTRYPASATVASGYLSLSGCKVSL